MFRIKCNEAYLDFDNQDRAMNYAEMLYLIGMEYVRVEDEYGNILVEYEN